MTEFSKDVVRNRLELLGIISDMWVSDTFTEELKNKRERTWKKTSSTANAIQNDQDMLDVQQPPLEGNEDDKHCEKRKSPSLSPISDAGLPDDSSCSEGISGLPDTIPTHSQDPSSSVGPSLRRSQRSQSKRC